MRSDTTESLSPSPLSTEFVGTRVVLYEECESTNDRAFAIGDNGTVIVANAQTAEGDTREGGDSRERQSSAFFGTRRRRRR